jgi:PTH1 family peptidyl-tRNA hydrolase
MFFFNKKNNIEFIITGLGNPGKEYENTRHNSGFSAINYIAEKENKYFNKKNFDSLYTEITLENKKILLIKPQTFMNLSGQAVFKAMNFYKIAPERNILIFDDISFEIGKIRIKSKGSSGGHNGVKNIINTIKNENFPRIKIGIGKKPEKRDLADWVLSKFTQEELKILNLINENIYSALKFIISGKIQEAMSLYNS